MHCAPGHHPEVRVQGQHIAGPGTGGDGVCSARIGPTRKSATGPVLDLWCPWDLQVSGGHLQLPCAGDGGDKVDAHCRRQVRLQQRGDPMPDSMHGCVTLALPTLA